MGPDGNGCLVPRSCCCLAPGNGRRGPSSGFVPATSTTVPQSWAEQRRIASSAPIAIVGDSRILFDTDLDRFEAVTGVRPVQVSHVGTNARPLLEHFANDPKFKGLLIVGLADTDVFPMPVIGLGGDSVHNLEKNGSPRSHWSVDRPFPATASRVPRLRVSAEHAVTQIDTGFRPGAEGPYDDVWKLSEVSDGRQYFMWHRGSRPTRFCAAMRGTRGTASRACRCRRSSALGYCTEAGRRSADSRARR